MVISRVDGTHKSHDDRADTGTLVKVGGRDWNVEFTLDDQVEFPHLEQGLRRYLSESRGWFTGQTVTINVGDRGLTWEDLGRLGHVFEVEFNLKVAGFRRSGDLLEIGGAHAGSGPARREEPFPIQEPPWRRDTPLVLKNTCRSGASIDHSGDVVVLGDVNPGAQIRATGDIHVFGTVRGNVHAGADGADPSRAVIIAIALQPMQLRIGHHVYVSPSSKGNRKTPVFPEIAFVRARSIVVSPFTGWFQSMEERNLT